MGHSVLKGYQKIGQSRRRQRKVQIHGGHASPKKHLVVYNFLSFYSVILKLGTKKELVILKIRCFLFLRFLHFWRENDVTNCVPKFRFANMGYLMLPFERNCHKDLKTEKNLKYLYALKRYQVQKCEFSAILLLKIAQTHFFKTSYLLIGWTYFKTFFSFQILVKSFFKW